MMPYFGKGTNSLLSHTPCRQKKEAIWLCDCVALIALVASLQIILKGVFNAPKITFSAL